MSALGESSPRRPTGSTRTAVLEVVRGSGQPVTVHEIAAELGLHANSVRFHLSRLLRAGLLQEHQTDPDGPGRPRMVYSAVPTPPAEAEPSAVSEAPGAPVSRPRSAAAVSPTDSGYQLLAEMLAGHLAATSPTPGATAGAVGDAWGHYLAERPVPFSRTTEEASIARVSEILDRVGFSPERHPGDTHRLLLNTCPFRTVADHRPTVVCAVHLGLMRGALAEMDAPVEVARLDRFDAPHPCVARLRALGAGTDSDSGSGSGPGSGEDGDAEADGQVQNLPGWAGRVAI